MVVLDGSEEEEEGSLTDVGCECESGFSSCWREVVWLLSLLFWVLVLYLWERSEDAIFPVSVLLLAIKLI